MDTRFTLVFLQIHTRVCLLSEHGTSYMMKASILASTVVALNKQRGWLFQRWSWMRQQVLSRSAGHPAKGSGAQHCEKSKHCFNLSEKIAWVWSQSSGPFRAQPERGYPSPGDSSINAFDKNVHRIKSIISSSRVFTLHLHAASDAWSQLCRSRKNRTQSHNCNACHIIQSWIGSSLDELHVLARASW